MSDNDDMRCSSPGCPYDFDHFGDCPVIPDPTAPAPASPPASPGGGERERLERLFTDTIRRYTLDHREDESPEGLAVTLAAALLSSPAPPPPGGDGVREDGAALIAAERRRQIEVEGWTPEHDADEHVACELSMAADAYIFTAVGQVNGVCWPDVESRVPNGWPWGDDAFKPSEDPVRNLVKAGALIAAEIDRLRALLSEGGESRG